MIPVLYEYSETEYVNQGLGAMIDATRCIVTEELNGIYELEMDYPIDGLHYSSITLNRILLAVPSDGTTSQPFVIYKISKPMNGVVTVYAEHISYRLSYIPVVPFSSSGAALTLQLLKENCLETNPFTFWTDITENTNKFSFNNPQSCRLCMGGTEGSIVDTWYGEYEFDRFTVRFWSKRGNVRDTAQIIYGKNLTDLTQEENFENVTTGIYPYWKRETTNGETTTQTVVTLPEKLIQSSNADKYPYRRTVPYDFSSYFQEQPTEAQLRARAQQYVENTLNTTPTVSLTVSFVSLADSEENKNIVDERLNLGDTVSVYFYKLGVSTQARINKTVYNVLLDRYDEITLGEKSSLSKTISSIEKSNKKISSNQISIASVKESLSEQKTIMDGGGGGSVITGYTNGVPTETVYADSDNIETAKSFLRINKNGIAFSNDGENYTTAWTIDGQFSANFITSGELDGSLVKAGSIVVGALDSDTQSAISEGVEAKEMAQSNKETIINLQDQIDGAIETWFYDYAPTLTNEPASNWTTDKDKNKHLGDMFYDSSTGYAYRFTLQDGTYSWIRIADSDVTKALKEANEAQQTAKEANEIASTKATIYYEQPTTPYQKNDLWCQGNVQQESTVDDDDTDEDIAHDILICIQSRTKDEEFNQADWTLASNYTDDKVANIAQEIANSANDTATKASAKATEANTTAHQAQADATTAISKADNVQTNLDETNANVKTNQDDIKALQESTSATETKVSEAQKTANEIQQTLEDLNGNDQLTNLVQRTQIDSTGVTISSPSNNVQVVIQNDGMHILIDGKEKASYLADYANVAKIFSESGRLGKHTIQIFSVDGVAGTAFFYDENS